MILYDKAEGDLQFEEFWSRATAFLKDSLAQTRESREERLFISNWRPGKGFTDERFPVRDADPEKITCLSIHAGKTIDIPKDDMATLYTLWDDYLQGAVSKIEVVEKVPRTTYAISLMKYLKESVS